MNPSESNIPNKNEEMLSLGSHLQRFMGYGMSEIDQEGNRRHIHEAAGLCMQKIEELCMHSSQLISKCMHFTAHINLLGFFF